MKCFNYFLSQINVLYFVQNMYLNKNYNNTHDLTTANNCITFNVFRNVFVLQSNHLD